MIHNPILATIWTSREARVTNTIRGLKRILIEDAARRLLGPILRVHRVRPYKLQLAEAVIPIIRTRRAVNDEILVGFRIRELLRPLIRRKPIILLAPIRRLLPRLRRRRDNLPLRQIRRHSPRIRHLANTQIRGPGRVLLPPARVDVIQGVAVDEIRPVDGELVVRVQHAFHAVVARPGVCGGVFQHEHAVVHGWAVEVSEHVDCRVQVLVGGVRREDYVPFPV